MENVSDRKAKLQGAMSRAKKLIQLESNGTLDKIAKASKDGINSALEGSIMTEELITTARNRKAEPPMFGQKMGENAMNVPTAIREAFMKNPIDESELYSAFADNGKSELSFLTESNVVEPKPIPKKAENIKQIINEGLSNQQIDYPMIRTIVEEVVRKYSVSLKNKLLNESKQNTNEINTLSFSNGFKFLAKNGDIYEAKLTKIGNVNQKKKMV